MRDTHLYLSWPRYYGVGKLGLYSSAEGEQAYAMSLDLLSTYHMMLPIHFYKDKADLLATLKEDVIEPAEQKAQELEKR